MNISSVKQPIGLREAVQAIKDICNDAPAYAYGRIRIRPVILRLDKGNGQTTFVRYVADMLNTYKIRRFGVINHYLEYVVDGTTEQLQDMFSSISSPYTNYYEGVVAIDITALGRVVSEKQMRIFLREIQKVAQHAMVILFLSPNEARNGGELDLLEKKVVEAFGGHESIQVLHASPYTCEEYAEMVMRNIDDRGIAIDDNGHFVNAVEAIIDTQKPKTARDAESLAEKIVKHADYTHFVATIDTDRLRTAFPDAFPVEKGCHNAK